MYIGLLFGALAGCIPALIFVLAPDNYAKKNVIKAIISLVLVACFGGACGAYYDNYDVSIKVAKYEAAHKTYILSVENSEISEYERVAILQSTMEINQEIAETKTYVNSWFAFYITAENRDAVNHLKLIGDAPR